MSLVNSLSNKVGRVSEAPHRNANAPGQDLDTEVSHRVGVVQTKYFHFALPPDELTLECGERLGPITIAYETYGTLNDQRSNAILILHALSGDAHAAGFHKGDEKPGWWDDMIGPGRAFDTDKYFIISLLAQ